MMLIQDGWAIAVNCRDCGDRCDDARSTSVDCEMHLVNQSWFPADHARDERRIGIGATADLLADQALGALT